MNVMRKILVVPVALLLCGTAPAAEEPPARPLTLDIAAQPLADALGELAQAAKLQLIFYSRVGKGVMAPRITGNLTPRVAFSQMLAGTGLRFEYLDNQTVAILAPDTPTPPARSSGGAETSPQRVDGAMKLSLASDQSGKSAAGTRTEEETERGADKSAEGTHEVVVTGTNIRGLPKEYVASPIFSYTKDDMEQSGFGSLAEFIQTLPQNFTGDASEYGTSGVAFGTSNPGARSNNQFDGFASFSLRGLGSDATLTLLNGRRMPAAGMIETPTVSFIPSALIERMDIVPDGASATYGADAVGGVVNLITRRDFDGLEVRMRGSSATEVDRDEYQVSLAGGHSWSGGNVFGMLAWQDREPMVGEPQAVSGGLYEIAATPDEGLLSFFGGASQQLGDVTLSLEGSYFEVDRSSYQLTLPSNDRRFLTRSKGHSLYSSASWQATADTSFDLTVDYHENESSSASWRMGVPLSSRDYTNRLLSAEARGQTSLFQLPGGPVRLAGGAQYRHETLQAMAPTFFRAAGGERDISSVFAETFVPLIGEAQGIRGVRSLALSAALRYEDFGGTIGSAVAPKIGLRWNVNEALSLRTTFSQSFLVPRLRDTAGIAEQVSFQVNPDAFLLPGQQDPRLPAGQSLAFFRAGANPDVVSQDADSFTVGLDFSPGSIEGLDIGLGYYRVEFKNRIAVPLYTDILAVPELRIFATRPPEPGQIAAFLANPAVSRIFAAGVPFVGGGGLTFFASPADVPASLISSVQVVIDARTQNFASEVTDGLDFDVNYRVPMFGGQLGLRAGAQYILTLERSTGAAGAVSRLDTIYNPVDLNASGNVSWRRGAFSVGSSFDYVDGYIDNRAGQNNRHVASYTSATLSLGWDNTGGRGGRWFGDSSYRLVVANVFDLQPPQIPNQVLPFDPYNVPANPRTVALIVTKRMK